MEIIEVPGLLEIIKFTIRQPSERRTKETGQSDLIVRMIQDT
jgi:hypothetical protein